MSNKINIDWILYEKELKKREVEDSSRHLQLEIPEYHHCKVIEDKATKKEPKRVIEIDL